jgi:hypothetical protein
MTAGGYTVRAGVLAAGSTKVLELQSQCQQVAGGIVSVAGGAGDASVESAARGVAVTAVKQFLNADSGYAHTARQLTQTASS